MEEIWKPIKGFEGLYTISSWGRIKGKNDFKKPYISRKGYVEVDLYKNNKRYKKIMHRLVAEAFIVGDNQLCVNHKDNNRQNNHHSNLEWVTYKQNWEHQIKTNTLGRNKKGEFASTFA